MAKVTIDVESDWGGRSSNTVGLKFGIPAILKLLEANGLKAIFFISTELLRDHLDIVRSIVDAGHELGSHGHFHIVWKDWWRAEEDRKLSNLLLTPLTKQHKIEYRAPKFSHRTSSVYSNRDKHVGLLKYTWFGGKIQHDTIFYLHPFDIIADNMDAPNLFCRLWYSRPVSAYKNLFKILGEIREINKYHNDKSLEALS